MKFEKIIYFITPPFFYRFINKMVKSRRHSEFLNQTNKHDDLDVLKRFRREQFNVFFKSEIINEFCDLMEEQFSENPPVKAKHGSNQRYLDELTENGFCKIEGMFSKEQIKSWHDKIYPLASSELEELHLLCAEHGISSGKDIPIIKNNRKYCYDLRSGIIRIWKASELDESISSVFQKNVDIHDICNSYLSGKANESDVYVDFKAIPLTKDANLVLHADSAFRQVKVFLPLKKVTAENAPFIYYKKSHRLQEWRLLKDFLSFTNYNSKYHSIYGIWNDIEMGRFAETYPDLADLESVVTMNEGDVIIADTRGVHGGSLLFSDYRLQLGMSFSMVGNFHSGYIPQRILKMSQNVE